MVDETAIKLQVGVDADTDPEEIDALTRSLRRELAELDLAEVRQVEVAEVPLGAKSGVEVVVGTLLVTLVQTAGAGGIALITGIVQTWLARGRGRTVELEVDGKKIKITGALSETEQRMIDEWMKRITQEAAGDER